MTRNDSARLLRTFPAFVAVLLAAFVVLFLAMPRSPNIYDEGLVLTNAMRVAAGQLPHRDFYAYYGPAELYILAWLFKLFGQSLLVERLFDLLMKSVVVAFLYAALRQFCCWRLAACTSFLALLWLAELSLFANPVVTVSLLNLMAGVVISVTCIRPVSAWRLFIAGCLAGIATLFRYDTGAALLVVEGIVLGFALWRTGGQERSSISTFARMFAWCAAGFAVITVPAALFYLAHAPASDFIFDLITYPRKYYSRGRSLPFPNPRIHRGEAAAALVPLMVMLAALFALAGMIREKSRETLSSATSALDRRREGLVFTFAVIAALMYAKAWVRISPVHLYLSTIASLFLISVLMAVRPKLSLWLRRAVVVIYLIALLDVSSTAVLTLRLLAKRHDLVANYLWASVRGTISPEEKAWCAVDAPLTHGLCFHLDEDREKTVDFIRSHTALDEKLFVGNRVQDRVLANDNVIYFAAQRIPYTKWSDFNPLLQNSLPIQQEMVREMNSTPPPFIVRDSEFEFFGIEANESSKSSGVGLFDEYLKQTYSPVARFGYFQIEKSKSVP